MLKMHVEGGAQLVKALEQLSPRVSKNTLKGALQTAGEPIRSRMSEMAPRAPGEPDMADHMVITPVRVKRPIGSDGQAAAVAIGPAKEFFYSWYQEFGTVFHAAHPFARPAFDGGVRRAISDLTRFLWSALASRGISTRSTASTSEGRFL